MELGISLLRKLKGWLGCGRCLTANFANLANYFLGAYRGSGKVKLRMWKPTNGNFGSGDYLHGLAGCTGLLKCVLMFWRGLAKKH